MPGNSPGLTAMFCTQVPENSSPLSRVIIKPPNWRVVVVVLFFKLRTDNTGEDNPFFETTLKDTCTVPPVTSETSRGEMVQLSTLGGVESKANARVSRKGPTRTRAISACKTLFFISLVLSKNRLVDSAYLRADQLKPLGLLKGVNCQRAGGSATTNLILNPAK